MNNYLTIKQTVEYIKRTDNTIRRVLIQKRHEINKEEGFDVVKRVGNKYYIHIPFLDKRYPKNNTVEYNIKTEANQPVTEDKEELRDLQETIKMYSIMLGEKDKLIEKLESELKEYKEDKKYLKEQFKTITTLFDQSQKIIALKQGVSFIETK